MPNWNDVEAAAPLLVAAVRELFRAHLHHTMATIRRDGSPRLSGTAVHFDGDDLWLALLPNTRRGADLQADPRITLFSHTIDPPLPPDDLDSWPGEARVAGRAVLVQAHRTDDEPDWFRIDVTEMMLLRVGDPDHSLIVESWHLDRGVARHARSLLPVGPRHRPPMSQR